MGSFCPGFNGGMSFPGCLFASWQMCQEDVGDGRGSGHDLTLRGKTGGPYVIMESGQEPPPPSQGSTLIYSFDRYFLGLWSMTV